MVGRAVNGLLQWVPGDHVRVMNLQTKQHGSQTCSDQRRGILARMAQKLTNEKRTRKSFWCSGKMKGKMWYGRDCA